MEDVVDFVKVVRPGVHPLCCSGPNTTCCHARAGTFYSRTHGLLTGGVAFKRVPLAGSDTNFEAYGTQDVL
jgi:hypothetical protein